tara:strand:+ start:3690 stop:4490 length:801 start_codon:yes stop_codon:yes gene_type:complete
MDLAVDPETAPSVIQTIDLSISFGGHVAVSDVSCHFDKGTLTAIVGPNGAGKTTYFNLISGQLKATSGQVLLNNEDIVGYSVAQRTRLGIGRAFQLTNLFPKLSVRENIRLAVQSRAQIKGRYLSLWSKHTGLIEKADHYLELAGLSQYANSRASTLSHGDQRKLEVALLMALEPMVYMFDEPTAGMSVDEVPIVLELIQRIKKEKDKTILLVEHKLDVIRSLADRIVVLNNGAVVADGDPVEVMASDIVREAYLGRARSGRKGEQ